MISSPQENLHRFNLLFFPLIIVSKVIRWTILWKVLVSRSIGHAMLYWINTGGFKPFHSALTDLSEGGSSGIALNNAMALFHTFKTLFGIDNTIQWEIFFTIVFNFLIYMVVRKFYLTTPNIGWKQNVFIYMAFAILNIFCLNLSKEPYQLIFFLLMGWGITYFKGYKNKSYWIFFVLVLTILYARKYYVLVIAFYIAAQFFVKKFIDGLDTKSKSGKKMLFARIIYMLLVLALFHFAMYHFIAGANSEAYEDLISVNDRDQNRSSTATSEIVPIFGSSNQILVTLEFFAKIFRLSFPIELMLIGKFTYVFVIAFQMLLVYSLVRAFANRTDGKHIMEEDDEEETETNEQEEIEETEITNTLQPTDEDEEPEEEEIFVESEDRKQTRTAAFYFYIAFLLCSACFEPDFGSWTRHLGVAFPVLVFIL